MVIIDNSNLSFAFHLDNGIPILPFYDNKKDNELVTLVNYLNYIAGVKVCVRKTGNFKKWIIL